MLNISCFYFLSHFRSDQGFFRKKLGERLNSRQNLVKPMWNRAELRVTGGEKLLLSSHYLT
jgi:hypothetical protein